MKLEKIGTGGKAEQRKHLRSAWHLGSSQSFPKSKATVKKRTETKKQTKKYQLPRFAKGKAAVSALSRAVEFIPAAGAVARQQPWAKYLFKKIVYCCTAWHPVARHVFVANVLKHLLNLKHVNVHSTLFLWISLNAPRGSALLCAQWMRSQIQLFCPHWSRSRLMMELFRSKQKQLYISRNVSISLIISIYVQLLSGSLNSTKFWTFLITSSETLEASASQRASKQKDPNTGFGRVRYEPKMHQMQQDVDDAHRWHKRMADLPRNPQFSWKRPNLNTTMLLQCRCQVRNMFLILQRSTFSRML